MGRRLYHKRARGINPFLFKIYNIDFWQYGWLYLYINSNQEVLPWRQIFPVLLVKGILKLVANPSSIGWQCMYIK
jgi:hypothetical protein